MAAGRKAKGKEETEFDLQEELGASATFSTQKLTVYLPDKNKNGEPIPDIEVWVEAGMRLLADINLGVTRLPAAQGIWKPTAGAPDLNESTVLIYSYLREPEVFLDRFDEIRAFLHEFGRSTNQGEVMVELFGESVPGGDFYFRIFTIDTYDPPAAPSP